MKDTTVYKTNDIKKTNKGKMNALLDYIKKYKKSSIAVLCILILIPIAYMNFASTNVDARNPMENYETK